MICFLFILVIKSHFDVRISRVNRLINAKQGDIIHR